MKVLVFFTLLFSSFTQADTKIVELSTDRAVYSAGDNAVLRAMLFTRPDNHSLELEVLGNLNGVSLPVERVTDFEHFSTARGLEVGSYTWTVEVFIQDARLARDLKNTVSYAADKIVEIDQELATNPPPERVEELLIQKARYERLKATAEAELLTIRTKIHGPVGISFQVE